MATPSGALKCRLILPPFIRASTLCEVPLCKRKGMAVKACMDLDIQDGCHSAILNLITMITKWYACQPICLSATSLCLPMAHACLRLCCPYCEPVPLVGPTMHLWRNALPCDMLSGLKERVDGCRRDCHSGQFCTQSNC